MSARMVLLFALAAAAAPVAAAETGASAMCADQLSPEGRLMYDAALPAMKPNARVPEVLRARTAPLVMHGKLTRSIARANGVAVGRCLALLQAPAPTTGS